MIHAYVDSLQARCQRNDIPPTQNQKDASFFQSMKRILISIKELASIVSACAIVKRTIMGGNADKTGLVAARNDLAIPRSVRPLSREPFQMGGPCAIPYIFPALNTSITPALIGETVDEFVPVGSDVSTFIQHLVSRFTFPQAWAEIGVLVYISLAQFHIVEVAQRVSVP